MMIFILLFTFFITCLITRYLSKSTYLTGIIDQPNERSLHIKSTSRIGGLAIFLGGQGGIFLCKQFCLDVNFFLLPLLVGLIPLVIISFCDDCYGILAKWRILVHIWAAFSLVWVNYTPNTLEFAGVILSLPVWVTILPGLLSVVWMINLYNFMDGMDGFAGGMAVIGFATLAWLGRTDTGFAAFCMIVAAASAGFLVHNFPPAKIFMGDTGSTALGFLVAACSLWGSKTGLFPLWAAILIFSPFIVDATVTLLRRLLQGEKIWEAHRTHYYQRLVLLGWGHRRTVLTEYVLMLACSGSAVLAVHFSSAGQAGLIVAWLFVYGFLMWGVGWLERRHAKVANP